MFIIPNKILTFFKITSRNPFLFLKSDWELMLYSTLRLFFILTILYFNFQLFTGTSNILTCWEGVHLTRFRILIKFFLIRNWRLWYKAWWNSTAYSFVEFIRFSWKAFSYDKLFLLFILFNFLFWSLLRILFF